MLGETALPEYTIGGIVMDFCQTQTAVVLMRAFAGECQAQMRYTLAAKLAKKQQLPILQQVLQFTAKQEQTHAQLFAACLQRHGCTEQEITAAYPIDPQEDLAAIFSAAQQHELNEAEQVYPAFAQTAAAEGFSHEAELFRGIAEIERSHAARFGMFAEMLRDGTLFRESAQTMWLCMNCGHLHYGTEPPQNCPVCGAVQGYAIRRALAPYTAD